MTGAHDLGRYMPAATGSSATRIREGDRSQSQARSRMDEVESHRSAVTSDVAATARARVGVVIHRRGRRPLVPGGSPRALVDPGYKCRQRLARSNADVARAHGAFVVGEPPARLWIGAPGGPDELLSSGAPGVRAAGRATSSCSPTRITPSRRRDAVVVHRSRRRGAPRTDRARAAQRAASVRAATLRSSASGTRWRVSSCAC